MFNVCPNCGEYRADKIIVPEGAFAVCPVCGFQHKFVYLPLFVLTGASGAGKTTTCLALTAKTKDFVIMESDILRRDEFNQPATDYRNYRETWLRVCKNIAQAGKPVILCGAGVPAQFEQCIERRYFSKIHYLALICDDEALASRLRNRPMWRGSHQDEYIREHIMFNRWLKGNAESTEPPMALLDTSAITEAECVAQVESWAKGGLRSYSSDI
jgi:adenylate kinase family enzyme